MPQNKFSSKPDTIDTGIGHVPRMYHSGGHELVFDHLDVEDPGNPMVAYRHPTKPMTTSEKRYVLVELEKVKQ